ncbi:helix-turn-helix domain-containing protein [Priestia koreensis]|uniref:helix-turn-helix domain-containing protein n=1 Tax=Priestia koreensis TaxID=284581 RepID=UPI003CFD0E4D
MNNIGQRIKERRKFVGLTQGDLSGPNLSIGMISLIERNKTNPSLKTLEEIADKLGVSINFLLDNEGGIDPLYENMQLTLKMLRALIKTGKYADAENIFNDIEQSTVEPALKGHLYKLKGELLLALGNYSEAITYFNNSLSFLTPYDLDDYISVYSNISTCYGRVNNYQMSIEMALQGLLLLKFNYVDDNTLLQLKLYYNQALGYCRLNELEKGLSVIEMALELMQNTNCYYNEGLFYMLKGLVYLYLKEFNKGIEFTKKGISLLNPENNKMDLIGSLTNLGILYREINDYETSLKYLNDSLQLCIKEGIKPLEINNDYEIALTQFMVGNIDIAEKICQKELLNGNTVTYLQIKALLLLSHIKLEQQVYGESLIYVNEARIKSEQCENKPLYTQSLILKYKILSKQGYLKEATDNLVHALQEYEHRSENLYESLPFIWK